MIKKLLSFACCLLPMGAGAVVVNPESGQNSISTEQTSWADAIAAGDSITINSALVNGISSANGFSIANNMYVGMATDQGSISGDLYVLNTVQNPFTVVSTGDISIGAILQVLDGKTLGFKTSDTNPVAFNLTVGGGNVNEGIKIGSEQQNATLNMENLDKLTVNGSIIAYGNFTVGANSLDVGLINANSGDMNISATAGIEMGGLVASGDGDVNITAGTTIVSDGTIQNLSGEMALVAGGDITVTGNVENKSSENMSVRGADMVVSGTMTNEATGATLTLNLGSWSVNGGTQSSYSFVNSGNLFATVSGETYMEYGINLGGMTNANVFSLDTGTLVFGSNATSQTWFNAFSNSLNSFNLAVRDGDVSVGTILNGINSDGIANASADMSILAQNVSAETVRNSGDTLVIKAADLDSGYDIVAPAASSAVGNINISGQVIGNAGTTTDIIAAGTLTVQGAVSNVADMTLNGNAVKLTSVSNSGLDADLTVSSLTANTGLVSISGNVTNANGNTTIWAKDVSIGGTVTNNGGLTTIRGSDNGGGAVAIGSLVAAGGTTNLDALAGSVAIDNVLTVAGGMLNLGDSLKNLTVGGSVQIAGDVTASANSAATSGDVNIAASGSPAFVLSADAVVIGGNITATDDAVVRNVQIDSVLIDVSGDATVANQGMLTLGKEATAYVKVDGDLTANNGGVFESYANDLIVGTMSGNGKFIMHGANITADAGNIDIAGNVYFDAVNDPTAPASGLVVRDTSALTLKTTADGADILLGAVSVGSGDTLTLNSADVVEISGVLANNGNVIAESVNGLTITGNLQNTGTVNVLASLIDMQDIQNSGSVVLNSNSGAINVGNISTSGSLDVTSATDLVSKAISQTGGVMDLNADSIQGQSLVVSGAPGTQANLTASSVEIAGNVNVSGNMTQGGTDGMLNLRANSLSTTNLTIGGDFIASAGNTTYDVDTNITLTGAFNVDNHAVATFNAGNVISGGDVVNNARLTLNAQNGITLDKISITSGVINIDSGAGVLDFTTLAMNGGNIILDGAGLVTDYAFNPGAMLYQNYNGALLNRDINVLADTYQISTPNLIVGGINQNGTLVVNSSDIDVGGDIIANDLQFIATKNADDKTIWQNVDVVGNVSGGVDFIGLEKMTIGGNYVFDSGSRLYAAVLPYATGVSLDTTDINYWSTISLNNDNTLGDITNAADGQAMISVGGTFTSGVAYDSNTITAVPGATLADGQIGISLFDVVDQGTAIWFLHADGGVENFSQLEQLRNLDVKFCNADGSLCYNYLESLDTNNGTESDLPVFVSVRDSDEDGVSDSLYIVFDPRFGGPQLIENLKIQPIVAREPDHTKGEYVSAGALDDLLEGQAYNKKFFNGTPIEVIPLIFEDTNMEKMAQELYDRMEYYVETSEGEGLARFSRLFQVREIEQIMGGMVLNEHTTFRSFEDRMYDEFIWNRNRQLKKAWLDVDYGMFYQNIDDGKHTDGHRFSVAGGFDWQESDTLVLGLTGRVSHTSSFAHDDMNLGYRPDEFIAGDVRIDVADTDIAVGGYLMQILNEKMRLYGNAFMDLHVFDVNRSQNFVDSIDGDGLAFSLITEWGLMHDILNQYVVGNLYARAGYNFGFNVKEQAQGDDYMRLKSDGYFILTPGYSLTAQKRIYPSAWFQIRPYASIGVEYDLFGAPDYAKYKFVPADEFTRYDIEIDPLWANIGGGIEMLSANGVQVGVDYRYQYNNDIQLHNIRVSGSYRF